MNTTLRPDAAATALPTARPGTPEPTHVPQTLDLRTRQFMHDPHVILRRLREHGPLHRDTLGAWIVTGHAPSRALLTDSRCGRDPRLWLAYPRLRPYLADSTLEQCVERWMLLNDGQAHARMRGLVSAAFTPAAIRALTVQVEQTAQDLVDALPLEADFDFMREFAQLFPVRVISDMLGLPAADFSQTKSWSDALALVVEPVATRAKLMDSDTAAAAMLDYLRERVAARRRKPLHGLLDLMIAAHDAAGGRDDDELLANLMLLFVAGHETTTNLLGNGLLTLLRHPDQLAVLRAQPQAMDSAVNEMLRFESPVNFIARIPRVRCELAGQTIGAGELIYCAVSAANRDPEVFPEPDRFDILRTGASHLSFGGGPHYCIGAPLARLEARVAFARLLARFHSLRIVDPQPEWRPLVNLRGLARLNLRGTRARPETPG